MFNCVYVYIVSFAVYLECRVFCSNVSGDTGSQALDPRVFPVYALYFANSPFSITPRKSMWKDAVEICKQRNARLAEFANEDEFINVLQFIRSSGIKSSKTFWTGIHFLRHKDYWGIHTGEAAKYLRWSPAEPRLFEGEEKRECVMLWNPSKDRSAPYEWNFSLSSESCDVEMFSICRTNTHSKG